MRRRLTVMLVSALGLGVGAAVAATDWAGAQAPEMRTFLESGKSAMILRDGRPPRFLEGRGVKPLLDELAADTNAFAGVTALDKVIGRAAAAIYVYGRAKTVIAPVMSAPAKDLLTRHGVTALCEQTVPLIINRKRDGMCPMDKATLAIEDPAEIVAVLRKLTAAARGSVEKEGGR